jgi:hypothetical protein
MMEEYSGIVCSYALSYDAMVVITATGVGTNPPMESLLII